MIYHFFVVTLHYQIKRNTKTTKTTKTMKTQKNTTIKLGLALEMAKTMKLQSSQKNWEIFLQRRWMRFAHVEPCGTLVITACNNEQFYFI